MFEHETSVFLLITIRVFALDVSCPICMDFNLMIKLVFVCNLEKMIKKNKKMLIVFGVYFSLPFVVASTSLLYLWGEGADKRNKYTIFI